MRLVITAATLTLGFAAPATALTFKKGEVLGPDGNLYTGASPEQVERLISAPQIRICRQVLSATTYLLWSKTRCPSFRCRNSVARPKKPSLR